MNKLCKLLIGIIVLLLIILSYCVYLLHVRTNECLRTAEQLYLKQRAIEDAGFKPILQDDGSYRLELKSNE